MASENVLNLVDLDDIDLLRDVERAFGIKVDDAEAESCETVGDVFEIVLSKMNVVERDKALPCFSAAAFRGLRRAMLKPDPSAKVGPGTLLTDYFGHRDLPKVWRNLEERSGLSLPTLVISVPTAIGSIGAFFVAPALWLWLTHGLSSGFLFSLGLIAISMAIAVLSALGVSHFARRYIPYDLQTFGDLAEATAKLNIGAYATRFGAVRNRDVWSSLVYIIGQYGSLKTPINSETRFFPKRS